MIDIYREAKVVAEIGCNHRGSMKTAKRMIEIAARGGAHYAKFQKRNNRELLSHEEYSAPHPVEENSYGKTYGEHREFLEFSIDQHSELQEHCQKNCIGYACSVWDSTSARQIASLCPDYIKIPSASNLQFELYDILFEYPGQIHVSLGMTTRKEERAIYQYFVHQNKLESLVFYHCTSAYPAPFGCLCLRNLERLQTHQGIEIGYSGHHLGIAADVAAYTLGAKWIERHFTLDRSWKGTDHAASLEPEELKKLVVDLRNVQKSLAYRNTNILDEERFQRKKLKKVGMLSNA